VSTVINLRGTGGSGKSTVVRRVVDLYQNHEKCGAPGRRQPYYTQHWNKSIVRGVLRVPGHYETACGGCDTIKTVDEVYGLVMGGVEHTHDVLYEGIMVQDDLRRAFDLDTRLKAQPWREMWNPDTLPGLHVICLTTPLEVCLDAIRTRRLARGDERPLDPKNTTGRYHSQLRMQQRLRDAGVQVEALDREAAFLRCCALLRLAPPASSTS
jgi:ABC-type dipeptide/oligopeptide/nickel transport system ATPase subunit